MEISIKCVSVDERLYNSVIRPIEKSANKGTNGSLSIIAGSECYRGAACLAVGGAMKTGVGIVRLVSVEKAVACTASRYPSATFLPIQADSDGIMDYSDFKRKSSLITEKSTAVLCGCGLGQSPETMKILNYVIPLDIPVVFDADALNLLSEDVNLLKRRTSPTVITPHIGEMSRLVKKDISEIKSNRQEIALDFSKEYGVTVVLKDDVTFIATPDGALYSSSLGNEGLAKGGSGDVLAGLIAGYLSQRYSGLESAVLGCAEQGFACQKASSRLGARAMRPENLIE